MKTTLTITRDGKEYELTYAELLEAHQVFENRMVVESSGEYWPILDRVIDAAKQTADAESTASGGLYADDHNDQEGRQGAPPHIR